MFGNYKYFYKYKKIKWFLEERGHVWMPTNPVVLRRKRLANSSYKHLHVYT